MTDHQSLQFLKNQTLLTGRMARWSMLFAERNCTIKYLKGKDNYVGDCLSRLLTTKNENFDTTESLLILYDVNLNSVQSIMYAGTDTHSQEDVIDRALLFKKLEQEDYLPDSLNVADKTMPLHEQIMFGRYRTSAVANLNISEDNYKNCKDFGLIYKSFKPILKTKMTEKETKQVSYRLKDFHIENDLLYYLSK